MKLDLNEIRQEIDVIDRQIVELFEKRMEIVLKVAAYKAENNMQVLDVAREQQVIANNKSMLHNQKYAAALECVLNEMMRVSRELQKQQIGIRIND